ncbi:winged helix-turn-helix domain-containing protein [Archaeoglobus sp.]
MLDVELHDNRYRRRTEILKILARSGVGDILSSLEASPRKFSQLMFETKLNPGILTRHLKTLTEHSIIEKNSDIYELTEKGRILFEILKKINKIF